ncbi:MAG: hypothetical protein ABIS36_23460 [Chryseolinea sp.]
MDLYKILSKSPDRHIVTQVVDYVSGRTHLFKRLINIYLAGPYRVTQFTAHAVEGCLKAHPHLIRPYLGRLITSIQRPEAHDSEKRNTLKLLQFINIPTRLRGRVIDVCFRFLQDRKEANAVRVFSLSVISNNAKEFPELQKELRLMIEEELPYATPAFRSRARKVLMELDE